MSEKIPVILCHTDILSGVTTWGHRLRRAFDNHGEYDFILVNLYHRPNDIYDKNFENLLDLIEFVHQCAPAIVVSNYIWSLVQEFPRKYPADAVRFLGMCHSDTAEEYYKPLKKFEKSFEHYIAVSPECDANLKNWIENRVDDITLLPYGIDVEQTLTRSYSTQPIRLVYSGRITQKQKRVLDFSELTRHLLELNTNFIFDLIGDGDQLDQLQSKIDLITAGDRVCLLGQVSPDKMKSLWKNYDVFLQASEFEGTSVSMLESMSFGLAPVVTDARSGVTTVITEGENGLIFPIGDMKSMAQGIHNLSQNRRFLEKLGKNAYQNSKNYSMQQYILSFERILQKLSTGIRT